MRKRLVFVAMIAILFLFSGCAATKEHQKKIESLKAQLENAKQAKQKSTQNLKELQKAYTEQQEKLQQTQAKADKLSNLLENLKEAKKKKQKKLEELKGLVKNISGMTVESRKEGNFIVIENKILFESGKIALNKEAKKTLDSTVIPYLKKQLDKNPDQKIRVDGHTDGQPISVSDWKDNYHLAAMRAHSVMEYLASQNIPTENMYICGFGPNRPLVSPPKPEAPVAKNRRVEILLLPKPDKTIDSLLKEFQK